MQNKIFHVLLLQSLILVELTLLIGLSGIPVLHGAAHIWLVLLLAAAALASSFLLARHITRSLTKPLLESRLEDWEAQSVCAELKPLALRMLEQNRQMERRLRKQFMELNRAHEKQDRQRRDFTANVSHELKTPLTSVSGYAEILRDGLVRPEDTRRFAGNIYDESRRLISLVEDILKLSELDDGYQQLENRVPVDLFDLCAETLTRLQSAAESRGVRRSIEGDHVHVLGVAKILGEIVYNLCDNAIKYNHPGGTVTVSVGEQGGKVLLRVRDDGIGISPEEQHRVFERFYRVDKSHSQEIGGTGLGLSIVKHGAAYHDARIELESTPGEGSEFRLIFHKMEKTDP